MTNVWGGGDTSLSIEMQQTWQPVCLPTTATTHSIITTVTTDMVTKMATTITTATSLRAIYGKELSSRYCTLLLSPCFYSIKPSFYPPKGPIHTVRNLYLRHLVLLRLWYNPLYSRHENITLVWRLSPTCFDWARMDNNGVVERLRCTPIFFYLSVSFWNYNPEKKFKKYLLKDKVQLPWSCQYKNWRIRIAQTNYNLLTWLRKDTWRARPTSTDIA